ncbi:dephospho-CoA kinase [Sporosarcina pasteurii]|uniref:Dephospho-CoA kinase n=1 Tax=Sporosarcina pasteurii TaxID=1474 RepID=A0A380C6P1_SPOPA|nr:dephospho-CoA kinase [Sporosarcina pasteurii]MDS9471724.1 dephospho-CoA kinase [Sporosarcina pasteurii]SUJ12801.1 Dephospho-CoA kinase [Sporosarcina pasteurii]
MIIGLTGSIASGKSTISSLLRKKGYPIVDADEIARLVVEPGTAVIEEIRRTFGQEVIRADGSLHRERLGQLVFGNGKNRKKLNTIIHPAIRTEMLRQRDKHISNGANTIIMDIPLLFESKLQSFVDKILVVTVTPEVQKERLIARNGLTEKEANDRINAQFSLEIKEAGADAVINNNGTIEESEIQLEAILKKWNVNRSASSE